MPIFSIEAGAYLWLAVSLLVVPIRWIGAVILAAVVHEVCHFCAIKLFGGQVYGISVRPFSIVMNVSELPPRKALAAALAGPLGGLMMIFFARLLPLVALCALMQSLWNLLPVYPLDGGRAVYSLLSTVLDEEWAGRISLSISIAVTAAAIILGLIYCSELSIGAAILLLPHLYNTIVGNIACKKRRQRVQ